MAPGRPRTYEKRVNVTTNIEGDLYHFGKDTLGIPAREAITLGYIGRIDSEITVQKNFTEEELDRYFELRNRLVKDLVLEKEQEEATIRRVLTLSNDIREEAQQKHPPQCTHDPETSVINWDTIPDEQKVRVYIQTIFSPDERQGYIDQYLSAADEDEQILAMTQFVDGFVTRFTQDVDRPFSKADLGEARRVLRTWAEAKGGV